MSSKHSCLIVDPGACQLRVGGNDSYNPTHVTFELDEQSDSSLDRLLQAAPRLRDGDLTMVIVTPIDWTFRACTETVASYFDEFRLRAVMLVPSPLAILIADGHTSGLTVDCGHRETRYCWVRDGVIDFASRASSPLAGAYVNTFFPSVMSQRDRHNAKCYLSMNSGWGTWEHGFGTEVDVDVPLHDDVALKSYTLPDGTEVDLSATIQVVKQSFFFTDTHHSSLPDMINAMFWTSPPLFPPPSISTASSVGDSTTVGTVGNATSQDTTVVCGGGCFRIPGMTEVLSELLSEKSTWNRHISYQSRPDYMAWVGGSIVSQLPHIMDRAVTLEAYHEHGPELAFQRYYAQ